MGKQEYSVLLSVSGVHAGRGPEVTADPGALLKIGVPKWLLDEEKLSEVKFLIPNGKL